MERSRFAALRRQLLGALALAALLACGGGPRPPGADEGVGERVVVEVLNASGRAGLARQVTRLLRQRGLDVIYFGNASNRQDSTLVLVRRGELSQGSRVARALGGGVLRARPDSLPRVDVTVLLGADYRLPAGAPPL